jgi:hypothetical protein
VVLHRHVAASLCVKFQGHVALAIGLCVPCHVMLCIPLVWCTCDPFVVRCIHVTLPPFPLHVSHPCDPVATLWVLSALLCSNACSSAELANQFSSSSKMGLCSGKGFHVASLLLPRRECHLPRASSPYRSNTASCRHVHMDALQHQLLLLV